MKPIRDIKDIENLKTDEKMIEFCLNGNVNYYRFLCFHPRNKNYVILLNHCEEPERFYVKGCLSIALIVVIIFIALTAIILSYEL